jgi:hypothetical protein
MRRQDALHYLVFIIFFGMGAVALGASVLCEDLIRYCRDRNLVEDSRRSIERLTELNKEYDALLEQLEQNPELIRRIATPALGKEPNDPNTAYPRARAQELKVARQALIDQSSKDKPLPEVPGWLLRCAEPRRRISLFVAGASLVIISLVCFTPERRRVSVPTAGPSD